MNLFEKLKTNKAIPPFLNKKGHFVVDTEIGLSLLVSTSFFANKSKYLILTSNLYNAQIVYNQLSSVIGKDNVLLFPADELIRAETLAQSKEMMAQRLYVLNQIINDKANIVVANVSSFTRYLPSIEIFKSRSLHLEVGKSYNIDEIKKTLIVSGYTRVNKIDQSLQFAVRGDILDIYSVNNEKPCRIEFFGDEIESIRSFELATQVSTEKIKSVDILPGNDIIFTDEEIKQAGDKLFERLEKDKEHLSLTQLESIRNNIEDDLVQIMEGNYSPKIYKYYSYLSNKHTFIKDYCKGFTILLADEDAISQSNKLLQDESLNYLGELHEDGKIISHLQMYEDINRIVNFKANNIIITSHLLKDLGDITFEARKVPFVASKYGDSLSIIQNYLNEEYKIVLSFNKNEHLNSLMEQLSSIGIKYEMVQGYDLPYGKVGITLLELNSGFVLPNEKIVYLTAHELFNEKVRVTHLDNRFKEATILKSFEDLEPGDYVVHEYHGIGQFVELQTLVVDNKHKDYLKIAYHGGENLYVPLDQFQLVRKYLGKEGTAPRLSRLHSKDWENTKKKIKERINDLANRLMNLYIERSKIKGYAFQKDDEFQQEFENSFPYDLTPDQLRAIEDIKKDMEADYPMDRLLCGDVGFGKTEVAFEAAFKAINSGKQVAILCPTTLLARQHYELAMERFSKFDIKIAVFSRLISEKKIKQYMEGVKDGSIHLAIGTHKLLSKKIEFKDLGLLIIDEEQRFGVEQKERLKELKTNIDVLTLSATPIPRTLQISLLGVRSMSLINTAPHERMPIQTYVAPFKIDVVKELIERELGRNGQVFYMHNNILTIYECASRLQKLLPNVNIGVAHGQMEKNEIEDVMMKFYKGEIDVLCCTSIIENGIDVPNANMIIVEDSENYGLSQLYQIKGRVGRSDRIAYAYLFYTEYKELNEKARKRLEAIQDFTALGSGYKIAQRDLMIRGAGDILGPDQAGFIDSIGLDMYIKLLNEAVKEKLNEEIDSEEVKNNPVLSLDAYIPSSYLEDSDKIELYQEILSAPNVEALSHIKIKTRDIYGTLPDEVDKLFKKRHIDLLVEDAKVKSFNDRETTIEITLGEEYIKIRGIGNILFEALIPYLQILKISYAKNVFRLRFNKRKQWVDDLIDVLKSLANIISKNVVKEKV